MTKSRRRFLREILADAAAASAAPVRPFAESAAIRTEFSGYDGMALAEMIRKKQVTPLELIEDTLKRIDAINPKLNSEVERAIRATSKLCESLKHNVEIIHHSMRRLSISRSCSIACWMQSFTRRCTIFAARPPCPFRFIGPKDGLPIGSQFAAWRGGESLLLGLAYELEAACPWAKRRPQIFAA